MEELAGRSALVTGGTTGLGRAIADAFLREGASVVITGRDEGLGREAEGELRRSGEAWFVRADAGDPAQVEASVSEAVRLLGGLDVLVNNAGIGVAATPLETPLVDYERVMDVNMRGVPVRPAVFPPPRRAGWLDDPHRFRRGVLGEVDIGIYSISKAAVHMLSNVLAVEGGRRGRGAST